MSVSTTNNRIAYAGNGVTVNFAYPYQFLEAADLVVIERDADGVETTLVLNTDYTVSGGSGASGTVTATTAPASGVTWTIYNDPALIQDVDFVENEADPAEVKETAFDKLTFIAQRLSDRIDRVIRLSEGFADTFDTTLPSELTALQLLGINADGDGFELYDVADIGAFAFPAGTGILAKTATATAVARTITAAADGALSISDGDGVAGNPTIGVNVAGATAETAPDIADLLLLYDNSATANRKMTIENFLKIVNGLTEDSAPATDDYLLTYDTSASGVKKASFSTLLGLAANPTNWIINGDTHLNQRYGEAGSKTGATNGLYVVDRFLYSNTAAAVHTLSQTADVPTLAESGWQGKYSARLDCTTSDTAIGISDEVSIVYNMEGYDWAAIKGQTVTLTFWVKAYQTGTFGVAFRNNGSDRTYVHECTIDSANTWEKKTVTLTLNPSGGTDDFTTGVGLRISWVLMAGTNHQTATTDQWQTGGYLTTANQTNFCDSTTSAIFAIAQIRLNFGSLTREMSHYGGSKHADTMACMRYYETSWSHGTAVGTTTNTGRRVWMRGNGEDQLACVFVVPKLKVPTMIMYSPVTGTTAKARNLATAADIDCAAVDITTKSFNFDQTGGASGSGDQFASHFIANGEIT